MGLCSLVYIMPKYNPDIDWNPEEPKQEYPDAEIGRASCRERV